MRLLRSLARRWQGRDTTRRRLPVVVDAALHVDADAVCPDCLEWIGPADHVRRNAYGLVEHDVCPPLSVRPRNR